ncbi:MAG: metal-dependent hydrolase [Akkermansiaceae bacterium]
MTDLTFYGHSCFSIIIAGKKVLFDPFITYNPLVTETSGIDIEAIEADYVLITHGHEDHVADAAAILKRTGATLIANYEIVGWFAQQGLEKAHPLNHGGSVELPFGKVKFVNAIHSSVLPDGTYGGNPGGFVIESDEVNCYISGDTALTYDMKLLGEFHKLDWAVLCIGDNFTMGHADAAICAEWIGVEKVVGTHFDSFPYIEIDHSAAKASFDAKGITLHLPAIGETLSL